MKLLRVVYSFSLMHFEAINCRFNDQLLSPKFEKARNGHLHLLQPSVGACLTIYQQKFYRFDEIRTRIWIMILIIIIISI